MSVPLLTCNSSDDGASILLSVSGVPAEATSVQFWGGPVGSSLSLLATQSYPYSEYVSYASTAGQCYNFMVVGINGSVLFPSVVETVYAKEQGLSVGVIDEVADYMEGQGLGVVGEDIFKFTYPQTRRELFLLVPTGGLPPDVACGQEVTSFSILYRSLENRPQIGYRKLLLVKKLLHAAGNVLATIRGIVEAQQAEPVFVGVESQNRTCVHSMAFRFRGPKR